MFATAAEKSIAAQLQELSLEASAIQTKIRQDSLRLEAVQGESSRIAEGLARGTEKESAVARNQQEIAVIQARIDGNNALLAPIKAKIDELLVEHSRQEERVAKEARTQVFESRKLQGETVRERILAKIRSLVTEDLVELNGIRDQLAREFKDLGGEMAGVQLGKFNTRDGVSLVQWQLVVGERWKMRGDVGFTIMSLHPPAEGSSGKNPEFGSP